MPTSHKKALVISIYPATEFIIKHYHQALLEIGIITKSTETSTTNQIEFTLVPEKNFDARLLVKSPTARKGLRNECAQKLESLTDSAHGGYCSLMDEFSGDINDIALHEMYQQYLKDGTTILSMVEKRGLFVSKGISDQEISRAKVNNAYVLTVRLLNRLILFILSQEKIDKTDHNEYFEVIHRFIHKITRDDKSPFKKGVSFDRFGEYLLTDHKASIRSFEQCMGYLTQFFSHKKAIHEIEHFISAIVNIIELQFIVYTDPSKDLHALETEIRGRTLDKLIEKASSSMELSLVDKGAMESHAIILAYAQKKGLQHVDKLAQLEELLKKLKYLQTIVSHVLSLINSSGWLSLLTGVLKLSNLGDYLEELYHSAEPILNIKKQKNQLAEKSNGYHALLFYEAESLHILAKMPRLIKTSTLHIENKELHKIILEKIRLDIEKIAYSQKMLGIVLVNPEQLELFTGKRRVEIPASAPHFSEVTTPLDPETPNTPEVAHPSSQAQAPNAASVPEVPCPTPEEEISAPSEAQAEAPRQKKSLFSKKKSKTTPSETTPSQQPEAPDSNAPSATTQQQPEASASNITSAATQQQSEATASKKADAKPANTTPTAPAHPFSKPTSPPAVSRLEEILSRVVVHNGKCDLSKAGIALLNPKEMTLLFEKIKQLRGVTHIVFKNNGFDSSENIWASYQAWLEQLPLIPASVTIVNLNNNGFELFHRKQLERLFSCLPSTVQKIFLYKDNSYTKAQWLERVTWPQSYVDMTSQTCSQENSIETLNILLNDYTKNDSRVFRFFSGHWNRHYIQKVLEILEKTKNQGAPNTALSKDILVAINEIPIANISGSLSRRLSFAMHLDAKHFSDMGLFHYPEEAYHIAEARV